MSGHAVFPSWTFRDRDQMCGWCVRGPARMSRADLLHQRPNRRAWTGLPPRPGDASRSESQMQSEATTADEQPPAEPGPVVPRRRSERREKTLQAALRKRAAGVPTYTVPEAAVLLSVSQEHLYRLIKSDAFPAVDMRRRLDQGRYIVPAQAVEAMLDAATANGALVSAAAYRTVGGAA